MTDMILTLEEFVYSIEDIPKEITHVLSEMRLLDVEIQDLRHQTFRLAKQADKLHNSLYSPSCSSSNTTPHPRASRSRDPGSHQQTPEINGSRDEDKFETEEFEEMHKKVREGYARCEELCLRKVRMGERLVGLVDSHISRLSSLVEKVEDGGLGGGEWSSREGSGVDVTGNNSPAWTPFGKGGGGSSVGN
ncbi:hypothetical protein HK097_004470, partial [Rhizophlyctis rosea]